MLRIIRSIFPGANIFLPAEEDGAHQCDAVVIHWKRMRIVLVDAKAKPAMSYYPDTGIDQHAYQNYLGLAKRHRAAVLLCFIDEACGKAYGNYLQILKRRRSVWWRGKNIRYPRQTVGSTGPTIQFPVEYMRVLADLQQDEIDELKHQSTRKAYPPNPDVYGRLGLGLATDSFDPAQREAMQ